MKTLIRQMIGAARMDARIYEYVESDRKTWVGAVFIVLIASIAAAFGSGLRTVPDLVGATVAAILTWLIWVGLTFVIGTLVLPESATRANFGEVLRTTGFSASPGVLRIFGLIPGVGLPIFLAITVWMLMTFVVAIRQALDYTTSRRAVAVCLLGWLIHGLLFFAFVMSAI